MIIVKNSRPRQGRFLRSALRPAAGWQWRFFGSLMLVALLPAITLAWPSSADAQVGGPTTPAKPMLNVVVIGDFYSYGYSSSTDPALRSSTPPTLQTLNQIQAANPGVQINVMFLPVLDATSTKLYHTTAPGTRFATPPQINAVKHANLVVVGVGANDVGFTNWLRSTLFGTSAPTTSSAQFEARFDNGSYLAAQTALLDDIATRAAPGASIVTVGYPKVLPEQLPSGLAWWSPFSWTAISQQQANQANQLVSALNTANNEAASIVGVQHPSLHFLYADLSGALQGKGPFGPLQVRNGATPATTSSSQQVALKQTIVGSDLLPYVDQAVNNELVAKGVSGSQHVPAFTPTSKWKLTLAVPVQIWLAQPRQAASQSGVATPPANTLENPAIRPRSSSPGQHANPVQGSKPADNGQQAPGGAPAPVSVLPGSISQSAHGNNGSHSGSGAGTGQGTGDSGSQSAGTGQRTGTTQPPADTGQGSAASQPTAGGQAPGTTQPPADTSQGSAAARLAVGGQASVQPADTGQAPVQPAVDGQAPGTTQVAGASQPAGTGQAPAVTSGTCAFGGSVPCADQSCGTVCPAGNGSGAGTAPVMPVAPAPLPAPITPSQTPGADTNPGTDASPGQTTAAPPSASPVSPIPDAANAPNIPSTAGAPAAPASAPAGAAAPASAAAVPAAPASAPAVPASAADVTAAPPAASTDYVAGA